MTVGAASATDMPIATRGRNTIIDTGRAISLPVAAALIFIALWEFVCHFYAIRPVLLPAPSLIVSTMFRTSSILWDNAIPTTMETVGGFVLSAVLGSALAVVMLYSKLMREILYPNIVLFQLIPKIALALCSSCGSASNGNPGLRSPSSSRSFRSSSPPGLV
jgi:NitT/TauT family transport system permease protein